MHFRALRLRRLRRVLPLLIAAASVLLSPALTLAGELHELVHELGEGSAVSVHQGHGHHDVARHSHDHHHDHDRAHDHDHDHDRESDDSGVLHALVHNVHGCGCAFGPLSVGLPLAVPAASADGPPGADAAMADPPAFFLLRPPRHR